MSYLPPLIDIGVNLTSSRLLKRLEEVLTGALEENVCDLMITGVDLSSSHQAYDLVMKHQYKDGSGVKLWSTAGIHPHDASAVLNSSSVWIDELKTLLSRPGVVAVGECGLDFDRDYSPRDEQQQVFEAQIELAVNTQKPLFLHERGAHQSFLGIMEQHVDFLASRGDCKAAVVHCFTGGKDELQAYLELGFFIGITGWICDERRAESLREAVRDLPLDRVLVETDAPYLLPRDLRPRPKSRDNEPRYLPHIVSSLARYMEVDPIDLATQSTQNARRLFSLDD